MKSLIQTTSSYHTESGDEESVVASSQERPLLVKVVLGLIWFYQSAISPFTPSACRFQPTCSHYMAQAVARYGARRGGWLGIKRICRCHPLAEGGYDPVPDLDADASHAHKGEIKRCKESKA